jgi:uncharacterized DUF497 family protein
MDAILPSQNNNLQHYLLGSGHLRRNCDPEKPGFCNAPERQPPPGVVSEVAPRLLRDADNIGCHIDKQYWIHIQCICLVTYLLGAAMQKIEGFIWEEWVVDKLDWKHGVQPDEVESVFFKPPYKVRRTKANRYLLYGRSDEGRYLFVVFAWVDRKIKVISARDMKDAERKFFRRK